MSALAACGFSSGFSEVAKSQQRAPLKSAVGVSAAGNARPIFMPTAHDAVKCQANDGQSPQT